MALDCHVALAPPGIWEPLLQQVNEALAGP